MKFNEFDEYSMKEDKILNNSYNTGSTDSDVFFQPIKVDDGVYELYKDTISDDMVEERTTKLLDERIYDLFIKSPYYEKYSIPKRVDRNDMNKMYYYFKDKLLKENVFSSAQIFIGFAEFFQLSYEQLYSEIGVMDKEGLLKELNEKFSLNTKIKTKKLF